MLSTTITDCNSFLQARILRMFLEADGYPAAAVRVIDGDHDHNAVISVSPRGLAFLLGTIAGTFTEPGGGGLEAATELAERATARRTSKPVDPALTEARNELRDIIVSQAREASRETGLPIAELEVEPVAANVTVDHDPGDEHANPPPQNPQAHNPEGGGWDARCREAARHGFSDLDAYDAWKAGRDVA